MAGRPPKKYSQATRLVAQALRLWRGGVIQPTEEAEARGVTRRSIERDLGELREAFELVDLRLDTRVGPNGTVVYHLTDGRQLSRHSRWQVLAAALGVDLSDFLAGERFRADTDALVESLLAGLLPGERRRIAHSRKSRFYVVPTGRKDYRGRPEVTAALNDVLDALLDSRVLRLTYHSPNSGRTRQLVVHPLTLVMNRGALYVIVELLEPAGGLPPRITLAVDRMMDTTVDIDVPPVPYPDDFDVKRFLASAFEIVPGPVEHVAIELNGKHADFVREHFWHSSATYEPLPGGKLRLHLDVACGVDLENWILSMAGHATVIAPPKLRAAVTARLRAGLDAHEEGRD